MLLKFDISAFTNTGTVRSSNQDHILVNDVLLNEGEIDLLEQEYCSCFVADGVGGNKAGGFASQFVLEKLKTTSDFSSPYLGQNLLKINEHLLSESRRDNKLSGTATTLTGLIIKDNVFRVIHAGDSQLWLLRSDMFFQLTTDQVLDQTENNSPITSYFGGHDNYLTFETKVPIHESLSDDLFLICSDGLFKSINQNIVKSILKKADKDLPTKVKKILNNCLITGAEDNLSAIFIHQIL